MTISAPAVYRDDYIGNDATSVYDYSFKVFDETHLLVVVRNPDTNEETELVLNTDYTVDGVGEDGGGSITLLDTSSAWNGTGANLETGWALAILLDPTLEQGTDLRNQGSYSPERVEDQLDKLLQIDLKQERDIEASVKLPLSVDPNNVSARLPVPVADSVIGWNALGVALENKLQAGLLSVSAYGQSLLNAANAAAARAALDVPSKSEAILDAIVDAKGDLIVGTAADTVARKAVGSDGFLLAPSSGSSDGLAWVGPNVVLNAGLAASVSSNALTILLKGADGNDPSDTNPVFIPFRSDTAATGTPTILKVNSATSLTISSGSTLGTTNSAPFRFWIVGFNDGGTFRLGLVNCLKDGVSVMALKDDDLASASAEGGAGGADSAHTIYAAAAVSSKPMRVLGWIEYSSGLATAGTYASAPTKVHILGPGDALPGQTVAEAIALKATQTVGTAAIPSDNTVPQNTEGTELVTAGIAVTSAANVLVTNFSGYFSNNTGAARGVVVALFRDSGANAKAATLSVQASAASATIPLAFAERAGAAGSTTMKIRFGPDSASGSGVAANGGASANAFGGADYCMLHVREVMA